MPQHREARSRAPFIPGELGPTVGPDGDPCSPLGPVTDTAELAQSARAVLEASAPRWLRQINAELDPTVGATIVSRHPEVHWTVRDGEAVLLRLDNGMSYTLNRVATVMWQLFNGDAPLASVLAAVRERFTMADRIARDDLAALVARLRDEGLVIVRS